MDTAAVCEEVDSRLLLMLNALSEMEEERSLEMRTLCGDLEAHTFIIRRNAYRYIRKCKCLERHI